jgi:ribose transport system substrate-binding protein
VRRLMRWRKVSRPRPARSKGISPSSTPCPASVRWISASKEELKKYPGLKLTQDKVADGQATTGLNITTDLITADPTLVGIFADNLIMGQGAGQAVAENKLGDKLALVAFDSDPKLVGYLQDGTIYALIVQDPFRMGYDGVKTALAASKGEKVEANVDTGVNVITKANMTSARSQELLNPKLN